MRCAIHTVCQLLEPCSCRRVLCKTCMMLAEAARSWEAYAPALPCCSQKSYLITISTSERFKSKCGEEFATRPSNRNTGYPRLQRVLHPYVLPSSHPTHMAIPDEIRFQTVASCSADTLQLCTFDLTCKSSRNEADPYWTLLARNRYDFCLGGQKRKEMASSIGVLAVSCCVQTKLFVFHPCSRLPSGHVVSRLEPRVLR